MFWLRAWDAKKLLKDGQHFREAARKGIVCGDAATDQIWGGWLGRYYKRMTSASQEISKKLTVKMER